jgi:hypothetical protein
MYKPCEKITIYAVLKNGKRIKYDATRNSEDIIPKLIKDKFKDKLYGVLVEKQKMLFGEEIDYTSYWAY